MQHTHTRKKNLFNSLLEETIRKKSLPRVLLNHRLKDVRAGGRILDLASGKKRPSYFRFLQVDSESDILSMDISKERNPDILSDLERSFPLEDNKFDCVFCFNLLEHIYNYNNVIQESFRVLRQGGRLIGSVPFLGSVHPDPDDFFRYTRSALHRILKEAGFKKINIEALGYGPFSVNYYLTAFLLPKITRVPVVLISIGLDKAIEKACKIFGKTMHNKDKYTLMYFIECEK